MPTRGGLALLGLVFGGISFLAGAAAISLTIGTLQERALQQEARAPAVPVIAVRFAETRPVP
jgi:hypothetical protein